MKTILNKLKLPDVFITKYSFSPYKLKNLLWDENSDPICFENKELFNMKEKLADFYIAKFVKENSKYNHKILRETFNYNDDLDFAALKNTLKEGGKHLSILLEEVEVSEHPILAMNNDSFEHLILLIEARVLSLLYLKYWEDIPDGKQKLLNSQEEFERLCSVAKLPRRTSAIIKAKRNN